MPFLSRLAKVATDYRAAKTGVAILSGASALSPVAGLAQDKAPAQQVAQVGAPVVKSSYVKPPMDLEPHCNAIKAVFALTERSVAKMEGEPREQLYSWIDGGCRGDVPIPPRGDAHDGRLFETAATILQKSSRRIVLTP